MFSVSNLCKRATIVMLHPRWKSKTHWAKLRRKNKPIDKAMAHFDEFYGSVFGNKWPGMKEALQRKSKYVALVNNYGDPEATTEYLTKKGAHCLKTLIQVQKDFDKEHNICDIKEATAKGDSNRIEEFATKIQSEDISSVYGNTEFTPERIETADMTLRRNEEVKNPIKEELKQTYKTLEESLAKAELDHSRIIDPSIGLTSEALYQYVPATKLKGMDDWLPESLYYSYYNKGQDFPLTIEPETNFEFPEHLKVYTFERDSEMLMFPEPKRCQTGVFNYYPLDCGSILVAISLGVSPGDRILDLCAAPGGKSLTLLQTLLPGVLVCNDASISRNNRLHRICRDYLFDFDTSNDWRERVVITNQDGRLFVDDAGFDKVLVDVPCTTDRHSVMENENNIFKPDRIKERLKIPEMQGALLANALKLVKVGGFVVYSTCSLSPIQNDGVVHMALKSVFQTDGIIAHVRDLTPSLTGLSSTVNLAKNSTAPKYGQLVLPTVGANFGPTYFAKLRRVK